MTNAVFRDKPDARSPYARIDERDIVSAAMPRSMSLLDAGGRKRIVACVGGCLVACAVMAKPTLTIPAELAAAPGIPCNVYFARGLESVRPSNYAFEAISEVGNFWEDRWTWTPSKQDAGRKVQVVFNVWDDVSGLIDAVTTTVSVAKLPTGEQKAQSVAVAILGASSTNSRYQDQLRTRMREAGFANYVAVGSHTGESSSVAYRPEEAAPHDGYGGFTWGDFLTRYAMTIDEIDNLQADAERDQLVHLFGVKLPKGQEWRNGLLKSPFVRIENMKKVVDIQAWFDKVNGGRAPDYVFITLGGNGIATVRPEKIGEAVAGQMADASKLLDYFRAAAPKMKIVVTSAFGGSLTQDGWGRNYGSKTSAFVGNLNRIRYDRAVAKLVAERNDPKLVYMTASLNVDPVGAYPHGNHANALHSGQSGGRMFGDALAAWLWCDLTGCSVK